MMQSFIQLHISYINQVKLACISHHTQEVSTFSQLTACYLKQNLTTFEQN
jgi:hypothetical protein